MFRADNGVTGSEKPHARSPVLEPARACRLFADLFADSGGRRRKKGGNLLRTEYPIDYIDYGPIWQSGDRAFETRQLHYNSLIKGHL